MATKLDTTRPLFMGSRAVRENTFNDHIRRAVAALDSGEGVPYSQLEDYLLRNYTPGKSANYGPQFIKSYVRDAVNKYSLLSYTNDGHEYAAEAAPLPRTRTATPRKPSKARLDALAVGKFIRDAGEVADASDVDNTQITARDIAGELNKRVTTVEKHVAALTEEGLLRVEETGSENLVYLTAAGLAAVNAQWPEGAESAEGADEAVEVESGVAEEDANPPEPEGTDADEEEAEDDRV